MKKIVEESNVLEDGKHEGTIIAVEYREKPYEYVDLVIQSGGAKLKCGYPFTIMPQSILGKKLMEFGAELKVGQPIDPDDYFINKKVAFISMKKGIYANILPESVTPMEDASVATDVKTVKV